MKALLARLPFVAVCVAALMGCTVHQTEAPDLAGPSEFALSFGITASPDALSQDGGSQSAIVVMAHDASGRPRSALSFRLDMMVSGVPVDYGTLSSKTIVTNGEGRATAVYTAPPPLPVGANLPTCSSSVFNPGLPGGCVQIVATPIGSDFSTARSQAVDIHLIPLGVILPPSETPSAQFTFSPIAPAANSPVQFDASASCAGESTASGGCTSGEPSSYAWDFGDGDTATGRLASHSYKTARTYNVTLTVTNGRGIKASTTKPITVGAGSAPTADFVFSPSPAIVGEQVYFDASASVPGLGHRITQYKWNWGDGDPVVSSSSPRQDHDYTAPGSYTVTLTVTDETGQAGTISRTVAVSAGNPVADFSFIVENPLTHTIAFDGRSSVASGTATITDYAWQFGDGNTDTGPTPSHSYGAAGTYTVKLTITDSTGKTGVVSKSVTVP